MKQETIWEIKNEMFIQIQRFERSLLDIDSIEEKRLKNIGLKIHKLVDDFVKQGGEDINLWVFLTYRDGKVLSKRSRVVKVEPITLRAALEQGFSIPETASVVEFEIKPVWESGYNRYVDEENIYKLKFGLNKGEELTPEQFRRRYKMNPNDNLYSVDDLKQNSKLLKFINTKKTKRKATTITEDVGLSL